MNKIESNDELPILQEGVVGQQITIVHHADGTKERSSGIDHNIPTQAKELNK